MVSGAKTYNEGKGEIRLTRMPHGREMAVVVGVVMVVMRVMVVVVWVVMIDFEDCRPMSDNDNW